VESQGEKVKKGAITEESDSPWNSPLSVVGKKMDASGKQEIRLVVRLL
jgi:hypothetical protein